MELNAISAKQGGSHWDEDAEQKIKSYRKCFAAKLSALRCHRRSLQTPGLGYLSRRQTHMALTWLSLISLDPQFVAGKKR